jgi:hypothetical protein
VRYVTQQALVGPVALAVESTNLRKEGVMSMSRQLVCLALLTLFMVASSCEPVEDNRTITCNSFARFNQDCTSNCDVTWSCESHYDALSVDDQITLDDCSDCLEANLANGVCSDCHDSYVGSCRDFLEDLLHVDCW